jgi:hypothetical protein
MRHQTLHGVPNASHPATFQYCSVKIAASTSSTDSANLDRSVFQIHSRPVMSDPWRVVYHRFDGLLSRRRSGNTEMLWYNSTTPTDRAHNALPKMAGEVSR